MYINFQSPLLFSSVNLFTQLAFNEVIKSYISTIFNPPFSISCIIVLRFILSGFPSHKNSNILFFIMLILYMSGVSSTVSGNISFGNANVFKTVILPIIDSLCFYQFSRQFRNCSSFGLKFNSTFLSLSFVKTISSVDAFSLVHIKKLLLQKVSKSLLGEQ